MDVPCQCMDAYIVKLRCFLHSVVFTFFFFLFVLFFHRPKGLIRNSPPSSRTRSVFWSEMVPRRPRKSSPATTKVWGWASKPQERYMITFLTGNVLLAANDFFLTMVFQAFRVLTIVPFGNADAVISLKGQIGVR